MTKQLPILRHFFGTALLVCGLACRQTSIPQPTPATNPWFKDVTEEVGLDFDLDSGSEGNYQLPELLGGGAAFLDFNNDGRLDVLLIQNAGAESKKTNRLYRQEPDGKFVDASAGSGLDYTARCQGVAVGDVNNDGWVDVCITEYGGARLFLNQGNGTFRDVRREAGIDTALWGTSAAFLDFDRDGWLDLVIVNYVRYDPSVRCHAKGGQRDFCGPVAFRGSVTHLFRNLGSVGAGTGASVRFEDVTSRAGLSKRPGPGLGVFAADFDGDGWIDLLIANDGAANHLWINQRDGTFREEAVQRGLAYNAAGTAEANMGIAVGDVDGDGLFDLFVTHLTEENHRLWKQRPRGRFEDRTTAAQLMTGPSRSTGFGTLMADFDNDGAVDLALVNGRVMRAAGTLPAATIADFWLPYRERNQVYANDGNGKFRSVAAENPAFCDVPMVGRGLACGDVDNDGGIDLLVTRLDGRAHLYRNVLPSRGNWLRVRAIDPMRKRDAHDGEVNVQAGTRRWVRWLNPGYSYACSNDPRVHFGLGTATHVDAVTVVWPDGTEERFGGTPVNREVNVRKGEGVVIRAGQKSVPASK